MSTLQGESAAPSKNSLTSIESGEIRQIKVFLNYANSYHGRVILKYLKSQESVEDLTRLLVASKISTVKPKKSSGSLRKRRSKRRVQSTTRASTVVESLRENPDSSDESEKATPEPPKIIYDFVITATWQESPTLEEKVKVDRLIEASKVLETIFDQHCVIYDLNFDISQVNEALQIVQALEGWCKCSKSKSSKKYLILITNPMTWARTE